MDANLKLALHLLPLQLWNTIYMVFVSGAFAVLLGLPLGILLRLTATLHPAPLVHRLLGALVNVGRSFPFAILMVALIPVTRGIVGTSLGTTAAIVPLTIAAIPFLARLVETGLKEVDSQVIEAAIAMGSNTWHIVTKVLLPEALPGIVSAITLTLVNLIGYSAMAGLVGGGGLGQIAIQYGYNRFNTTVMVITVFLLIAVVQIVQWIGNRIVQKIYERRGVA